MFKKKQVKYSKSFSKLKNNYNYDTINRPTQTSSSYFLNKSDPFIYTPQITYKKMAYLMTPCYIVDNDDINFENIFQYNKKLGKNFLNGFNLPSLKKEKKFNRTKSSEFLENDDPFYKLYIKNLENRKKFAENINNDRVKIDRNNNIHSARNKIYFPFEERKNNLFENDIKPIEYFNKCFELKKQVSSDKINKNKKVNHFDEFIPLYKKRNREKKFNDLFLNNKKKNKNKNEILNFDLNDFTLGGENNSAKILTRNRSNLLEIGNNSDFIPFNLRNNYDNKGINREILNQLYENNFINNNKNSKNQDFRFNIRNQDNNNKNNNNIKKNNLFEINTEKKPINKYSIFNSNNFNENNTNKSKDFLFRNNQNNKEIPYNKIFTKDLISSSNFSFMNNTKNIQNNKNNSINNNSNNSNTQSNNAGFNRVSTNYSLGPGGHSHYSSNRDTQKRNNNSMNKIQSQINSKPPSPLQISPVIVDEYFKESIRKKNNSNSNSNNSSNRISLQSLSDSKMLELAGHYKLGEESSSDNYQMNSIIHYKTKYNRESKKMIENNNNKIQKKNHKIKK